MHNKVSQDVYDSFNEFIFSDDLRVLGKMLYKYRFFDMVKDLPGDIVELGVFKGSGMATFSKMLSIFYPNSNKKIIGFDIFDTNVAFDVLKTYTDIDETSMRNVYDRVNPNDLSIDSVKNNLKFSKNTILVKGNVSETIPEFIKLNPGFRISLLYMDLDLETPTYDSLNFLWDKIVPGGVIVFDEYEYHTFTECNGVDKFLKEHHIDYDIKSTNFFAPTAFIIKK